MKHRCCVVSVLLVSIFSVLAILITATAAAAQNDFEGSYLCKTTKGKPCMSNSPLQLADGNWRWGAYFGTYTITNGKVKFSGYAGPSTWGWASIGPDTLTFNQFGDDAIWQKPSSAPARLAMGSYHCQTAPYGCQTSKPIILQADGEYTWGSARGSYSVVGGELQFSGVTGGPAGWGHAEIGNGSIIFRARDGSASVWALSGPTSHVVEPQPPTGPQAGIFQHSLYQVSYPPQWQVFGNDNSSVVIAPQDGILKETLRYGVLIIVLPRKSPALPFSWQDYIAACDRLVPERAIGGSSSFEEGEAGAPITISGRHGYTGYETTLPDSSLVAMFVFPENRESMLVMMFVAPWGDRPAASLEPAFKGIMHSLILR